MSRIGVLICLGAAGLSAQISDREAALGKNMMQHLGQRSKIVETPPAIAAIAQTLAPQSGVTVKVVESEDLLANSFPGGIVYISTALLESVTRIELTAILAHQMGHAVAVHLEQPDTSTLNSATIPLIFMGSVEGICSQTVPAMRPIKFPIGFQNRLTTRETEADALAAKYLKDSGSPTVEWRPLFERRRSVSPAPDTVPTLHR